MLLFVDKPQGYTSFDIIRKLQKIYPKESIGHAGTLDPMATGLLIIAIGKDTKKLTELVGLDKSYVATIDFSQQTDTWDAEYRQKYQQYRYTDVGLWKTAFFACTGMSDQDVVEERVHAPTEDDIDGALQRIIGTHMIPLTPFSAKKVNGKKLYEYARAGEPVFLDVPMTLYGYEIVTYAFPFLSIRLDVGSGTYIRSIAHRLGEQFGLGGILIQLRRTSIGAYALPVAPSESVAYA